MYYQHDPKLEAGLKTYEKINEKLKNNKQIEESVPTVNETNLVYYIDHLTKYIDEQNNVINEMAEVFNGIRKFTK